MIPSVTIENNQKRGSVMKYMVTAEEAALIDSKNINDIGIPSMVLMERAAMSVRDVILENVFEPKKAYIFTGTGNNGGDGIALARMLKNEVINVSIYILGNPEKGSEDFKNQLSILKKSGHDVKIECIDMKALESEVYIDDVFNTIKREIGIGGTVVTTNCFIVDAIFGTGLKRPIENLYKKVVDNINLLNIPKFCVDIPSGLDGSRGECMGAAVKGDYTITFGYLKTGHVLYEGKDYCGKVYVKNIGFEPYVTENFDKEYGLVKYYDCNNDDNDYKNYNDNDYKNYNDFDGYLNYNNYRNCKNHKNDIIRLMPKRKASSNKGTYGLTKIIAGSENMCGAAYLSGKAAYLTGVGLVKIITHSDNLGVLKGLLPCAVFDTYNKSDFEAADRTEVGSKNIVDTDNEIIKNIVDTDNEIIKNNEISNKDVILIGPGLGTDKLSEDVFKEVLKTAYYCGPDKTEKNTESEKMVKAEKNTKPGIVIDADGLNILSRNKDLFEYIDENVILTPHIKEMSRLCGEDTDYIRKNIIDVAKKYSDLWNCTLVIKDAATVVAYKGNVVVNTTGNSGMSVGGSGDVLAGIIAGLYTGYRAEKANCRIKAECACDDCIEDGSIEDGSIENGSIEDGSIEDGSIEGNTAFRAASVGTYLHGLAGDLAKKKKTEYGMLADDILECITDILIESSFL